MTRSDVKLLVNTPTTLDLAMAVSATGEVVNVASEVSQVNTTDASMGNPFSEMQVRQIPLQTRNVVELLSVQPGVTSNGEVLGARRDQNNVTLDGADVNNNQNSVLAAQTTATGMGGYQGSNANGANINSGFNAVLPIPLDSVQEFRVTVAGEGPNQGRSSGGQVTLVTKSGTNQLHGSLYEYNRDTATSANNWFSNRAGIAKEQLRRNQYGASLGGPIVKNRVFFFGNFERRQDDSAQNMLRKVPSAALRAATIMAKANDGQTYTLGPDALKAIDPLRLGVSPAMLAIFNKMPLPNDPASGLDNGLNFAGYRFNAPLTLDNRAYVFKADVKL